MAHTTHPCAAHQFVQQHPNCTMFQATKAVGHRSVYAAIEAGLVKVQERTDGSFVLVAL